MEVGTVIKLTVAKLRADTELVNLLGGVHIYKSKSRKSIQVPSVQWTVVSAKPEENEFRVTIQWDVWATSVSQMFDIEARLQALMHGDTPLTYGETLMRSELDNRRDIEDGDDGEYHSAIDFVYRPIREDRYVAA